MARRGRTSRRSRITALIVACALFMQNLDSTVIATALPTMARAFGADPVHMNVALTAYMLSLAVFIPARGWIADRFGAKQVFRLAIIVFTVGSVLCGQSDSLSELLAARIFQGLGGAMMVPVGRLVLLRTMGQVNEEFHIAGLNAKNSEFHAAMGIANLPYYDAIMAQRAHQWQRYHQLLWDSGLQLAEVPAGVEYNHSYFPVVFRSEDELLRVRDVLNGINVFPRRYFRPATTTLPYVDKAGECPLSESLSQRVLCLPMYHGLEDDTIDRIVEAARARIPDAATRSRELEEAVRRAQTQARIDSGSEPRDWDDTLASGRVVTVAHALGRTIELDGQRIAARLRITTAAATDAGLVTHSTTWDATKGPDPRDGGYTQGEAELIPWRSISSIRRTAATVTVESVTGRTVRIDVADAPRVDADDPSMNGTGEMMTGADAIARGVTLFVEAAQRKVATAH
jgi:hypothetical protein